MSLLAPQSGRNPIFQMIIERIETRKASIDFEKQLCSNILLQSDQCSSSFSVWVVLVFVFGVASTDGITDCLGYVK